MSTLSKLQNRRQEIMEIAKRHGVGEVKVFGSVVRNEDDENSDIDMIVSFERGRSLFDLINFKDDMFKLLERPVDVVTEKSLNHFIKDDVLGEAIML